MKLIRFIRLVLYKDIYAVYCNCISGFVYGATVLCRCSAKRNPAAANQGIVDWLKNEPFERNLHVHIVANIKRFQS